MLYGNIYQVSKISQIWQVAVLNLRNFWVILTAWWSSPDFLRTPFDQWPWLAFSLYKELSETKTMAQVSYIASGQFNYLLNVFERFFAE